MSKNRIADVTSALVDALRGVLREKDVTFEEYRAGFQYVLKTADQNELGLLMDLFLESTVIANRNAKGAPGVSASDLEGPYFIEDVPEVDGQLKVLEDDTADRIVIEGVVRDQNSEPLPDATIFVWSSTHDGQYGGVHEGLPKDLYRGKLHTDENGTYRIGSRMPVPYQIPNDGPVGDLLEKMGRHCWRPAHVHFKVRHPKSLELTTQVYFQGGAYLDDDCAEGIVPSEFVKETDLRDGVRHMEVNFTLQNAE